jgi:glycosyltransferase involved in cell wall biosynthesis
MRGVDLPFGKVRTNGADELKILIFLNSLAGGGTERVAATLANFWARKQWNVTVVTLNPESDDFYRLDPLVNRISLDLAGQSGGILDALRQNGRRIAALRRIIKEVRPAVVLSMMSTPNVLLAFASHKLPGVCTVGSEHCYPPHSPLGRIWGTLCSKMYGRLSAVVALTNECAEWIRIHSSATRVPVIPNAVVWPLPDNSPMIAPDSLCLVGRKVLLAVGRLDVVKNYPVLIRAFAQLAAKHGDWDLVILGEGPQRPSLEAIVRDEGMESRIFLPGIAGNVGAWYERADTYVMTSQSEGFPNSLAEALAHGLPAVSFDCDTGPRDIIRHDIDGFLVPVNDAARLVQVLDRIMGDAGLRNKLAGRAQEARERFSVDKIAGMWEELFAHLSRDARSSGLASGGPAAKRCGP